MWRAFFVAIGVVALVSVPQAAHAEGSAKEIAAFLEKGGATADIARAYIQGVGAGLGWANTALVSNGEPALFCVPAKLGITVDQSVAIFTNFLKEEPDLEDIPAGLVVLRAM